jgi:Carboxypeptidase regulatory-like domain/TonB dependent receptor
MTRSGQRASLWLILSLALSAPLARTQITGATLSGSVRNASGAALAGVSVSARSIETNLTESVLSAQDGGYSLKALPPGQYTLTASKAGFANLIENGVRLTVGQSAALDLRLQAGDARAAVTANAGSKLADRATAQISQVIAEDAIDGLPLNGRDPSSLVYLAAGVTDETISQSTFPQTNQSFSTQTGASAGGGRQGSTWYLLDGVPNMDTTTLLSAPFPNVDATREFRVVTNNFDSRYGFAPDAVVSIQTRAGTNHIHGGAFEFLRNDDLDAKQYFSGQSDHLRRNQFGAYAGGPILKNKLFFFADYQETRSSFVSTQTTEYTPTAAMLQGDFSAVVDATGHSIALHAPTGQPNPFQTVNGKPNQINPALFSPGAVALDKLIPPGQVPATGQLLFAQPAVQTNYREGTGRVDYAPGDRHRAFVRLFVDQLDQPGHSIPGNLLSGVQGQHGIDLNAAANDSWTLSASLLNSVTVAYISYDVHSGTSVLNPAGSPVCLSQFIQVSDPPGQCYINLSVSTGNGLSAGATGFTVFAGQPYQTNRRDWVLGDMLTKSLGRHTLVAGVDLFHRHYHEFNGSSVNPTLDFNGFYTGFILSDFLLGDSTGISQGSGEVGTTNGWMLGLYLQDEYRLLPTVTLSAGLRWDPNLAPSIAGGRGAAFVPGAQSTRFPNAPPGLIFAGESGVPVGLIPTTYGYLQPRVGVAWAATPRLSVRAGFGLFSTPLEDAFYNHVWDADPFSLSYAVPYSSSTPDPFDNPWSLDQATGGHSPFPPFVSADSAPATNSSFALPIRLPAVFSPNLRLGMTQSWNLSVEQRFFDTLALQAAYVGSESYHQSVPVDRNPGRFFATGNPNNGNRTAYASFGRIIQVQDGATANYNGLQAGVEKRFSHGFQAQSSFTWSKTFDVIGSGDPTFEPSVSDPYNIPHDHGLSSFNYPFVWTSDFIYRAPSLAARDAWVRNSLGGWEVSGLYRALSGPAFTVNGGNGNNNSFLDEGQDRADAVAGVPVELRKGGRAHWLNQYINPAAFAGNAPGTPGNLPKFSLQGPPLQDVDLAVIKRFTYRDRYHWEVRLEAFNALNHPSFCQPDSDVGDPGFGKISGQGAVNPRVLQAALKIAF